MQVYEFLAGEESKDLRLDVFLKQNIEEISRTYIQKLIKDGYANVNGTVPKTNYKVNSGDKVCLNVYEDDDVILINKPKGMVVHPAAGHYTGTLVNGLMHHCKDNLSGINGVLRPGIVHRIDMDTTGILIACKNDVAHQKISEQLKEHSITRRYRALVYGVIKEDEGVVNAPIGRHPIDRKKMAINPKNGKNAITHYRVLERFREYTYIECELETGRTHQIRVHMASLHHPLVGDQVYGPEKNPFHLQGQCLHAMVLGFVHPRTHEYMEFYADLPQYFSELLKKLPK